MALSPDPEWMLSEAPPRADARVAYGAGALQFGDLYLPTGKGPHPVVIGIHGGAWKAAYDLAHFGHAADALRRQGFAVWSIEYRRVGNAGGGFPGTFLDVAAAADWVRKLAPKHSLDLSRVVSVGHSAGGHLALWLAARHKIPNASVLASKPAVALRGVVGLAAMSDLKLSFQMRLCGDATNALMSGGPDAHPREYAAGSPEALLPLGVPQRLLHGTKDDVVPFALSAAYATHARERKDPVELIPLPGAGHFELINPRAGKPWDAVVKATQGLCMS